MSPYYCPRCGWMLSLPLAHWCPALHSTVCTNPWLVHYVITGGYRA